MSKLTLDDISDLRAYEREREDFRRAVIALKQRRRVGLGDLVTLVFENARPSASRSRRWPGPRIITDEGIETELRIYNPLIPERGQLAPRCSSS